MSAKANYAKIGLFVIAGLAIAVTAVVVLAAGEIFKKPIMMETYLDESVQGLDIGSPVKRRGVKIGKVDKIDFVSNSYRSAVDGPALEKFGRYVVVICALDASSLPFLDESSMDEALDNFTAEGLRVRLQTQLTGPAYLDLDHLDAARNPPLAIAWTPRYHYVPSAPSTITKYTESIDEVFRRIEKTDIEGIVNEIGQALETLRKTLEDAQVSKLSESAVGLMDELRVTNKNLQEIVKGPQVDSILTDVSDAAASAKRVLDSADDSLPAAMDDLSNATSSIAGTAASLSEILSRGDIQQTLDNLTSASKSMQVTAKELPETAALLKRTLRNVDSLVAAQGASLAALIENLRAITSDLRDTAAEAKRNPSRVLFGEPPPASTPGRKR